MFESAENMLRQIGPQDKLLVALSGGADSFAAIKWLSTRHEWKSRVAACHVNHNLRADANAVEDLARWQAASLGVPFTAVSVDVRAELKRKSHSIESCARRLRYAALENVRELCSCRFIVTAHTLDDDAETVLMKLNLGSSWYECTGIPQVRANILRPFLRIRRSQLHSLLVSQDLVDHDPMNGDVRFMRVTARNQLGAAVFTHPSLPHNLANHGQAVQALISLTSRLTKHRKINHIDYNFSDPDCLESLPKNLYLEDLDFLSVESAWATLSGAPQSRLKAPLRRQVNKFIRSDNGFSIFPLPNELNLVRSGKHIWLQSTRVEASPHSRQQQQVILTPGAFQNSSAGSLALSLDSDTPLLTRPWRHGEKFKPKSRRTRNVSDWLSEAGVHPGIRRHWPVLCVDDRIVAIPGLGVCESVAPRPGVPLMKIHWKAVSLRDQQIS